MATITIGADDFAPTGPAPAEAWFKFRRYRLDRRGPRLGSELAWTVELDAEGNATTKLPADEAGNAIVITSNYPGFTQVTVAGYPDDVGTLTALLAYEVDPATLRTTSSAAAAWTLAVDRVGVLVTAAVGYVAAAAASALDSARSALASSDSARSSGTSAFNAGQSAATSLGHANESAAAATRAAGSAAEAIGVANSSVVNAFLNIVDQQARLIFRRKNNTEFDVGDIRGPQGVPGAGVPWGVSLGNVSLDTITTPGVYRQVTSANATLANSYPYAGNIGILEVFEQTGANNVVQRFTSQGGPSGNMRGIYQRRRNGTVWDGWQFIARQRVDQTAGRATYLWDDVAGRDQLIDGDTGFRSLNELLGLTSGNARIRRTSYTVSLTLQGAVLGDKSGTVDLPAIPAGFLPSVNTSFVAFVNQQPVWAFIGTNGVVRIYGVIAGQSVQGIITFHTSQAWPTALPGTASGTIPNI